MPGLDGSLTGVGFTHNAMVPSPERIIFKMNYLFRKQGNRRRKGWREGERERERKKEIFHLLFDSHLTITGGPGRPCWAPVWVAGSKQLYFPLLLFQEH